MGKDPFRPGWALLILLAGHIAASAFMRNLGYGIEQISDPTAASVARFVHGAFHHASMYFGPPLALVYIWLAVRWRRGKNVQTGIDVIGGFLVLRCAAIFLVLNLLLLSQLRAGGLLLIQLILFLPVITIAFGWLYWRLDAGARAKGQFQIRFAEHNESPAPFDYFYIATRSLLQFEPTGAEAETRMMKTLFVLHGIMMLDLVALTLSRAISLASA